MSVSDGQSRSLPEHLPYQQSIGEILFYSSIVFSMSEAPIPNPRPTVNVKAKSINCWTPHNVSSIFEGIWPSLCAQYMLCISLAWLNVDHQVSPGGADNSRPWLTQRPHVSHLCNTPLLRRPTIVQKEAEFSRRGNSTYITL